MAIKQTDSEQVQVQALPLKSSLRRNRRMQALRVNLIGYLWLAPILIFFLFFTVVPTVKGLTYAFQSIDINDLDHPVWVGWKNFSFVLSDPLFWTAWINSIMFMVYGLLFGYLTPVVLAIAVNELRIASGLFRLFFYLPAFLPPVAGSFLWKWLYANDGLINSVLKLLHFEPLALLNSTTQSLPLLVFVATWGGFGGGLLFYIAALRGIPSELYDAAEIDGASIFRRIWHITIPQMRFIMLLSLITQITATMQVFNEPFLITGGGPVNSTTTVVLLIWNYAFQSNDFGAASALSLIMFVVLAGFSIYYLYLVRYSLGLVRRR